MILKSTPRGLYSHDGLPTSTYRSSFSGCWYNMAWSDVEATPGVYNFSALDGFISTAKAAGLNQIRVRPLCGAAAPLWAMQRYGSYQALDATGTTYQRVARWWRSGYGDRYDLLMAALATHIELMPNVIEVAMALTMSIYSEPFIRQMSDSATVTSMLGGGLAAYTVSKDKAAMKRMVAIHAQRFPSTRSGLASNPWQNIQAGVIDTAWTITLQKYARSILGARCILENNSMDAQSEMDAAYQAMYSNMQTLGAPLAFQTHATPRLVDPAGMVDYVVALGGAAIEPASNDTMTGAWTPTQMAAVKTRLMAV